MTESTEQIIEDDIIIIDADDVIVADVEEKKISAEQAAKNAQFVENVKGSKAKPLPTTKLNRRINVTKICNEQGYNPALTLIHIARNEYTTLGLGKPVSAHEMNSAAQTLLGYTTPSFRPVDFNDPDEELKQIPVFVGRRELPAGHAPAAKITYDAESGKYTDEAIGADGESVYGVSSQGDEDAADEKVVEADTKVSE